MTLLAPGRGDPVVSVVMVTHGAWSLIERAIADLVAHTEHDFELIVVDNRSEDETRERLSALPDVQVMLNEVNRGFGPATNQGAAVARAPHLVLLNTDAFVTAGWLQPLRSSLDDESIGAAVPRLLHPDGTLQEAGALLAQDGTVGVYGDGDDPGLLCYRFRRRVDYGSAACMLIRRSAFEDLGGFDDRFAPAYYEDTDLCLRLRELGLRVIYEPSSTVTHVRYGSSALARAIELSERNRQLFLERWAPKLIGRPATFAIATAQSIIASRDASASPRVLIRSPPEQAQAGALAMALLDCWPTGRVTWATGPFPAGGWASDPWLRKGVEIVDAADPSWLYDRLYHYDLVVGGDEYDRAVTGALERTQPQASWTSLGALDTNPESLRVTLAGAGIAPPRYSDQHGSGAPSPGDGATGRPRK